MTTPGSQGLGAASATPRVPSRSPAPSPREPAPAPVEPRIRAVRYTAAGPPLQTAVSGCGRFLDVVLRAG